jgi:hypothetical protein
MGLSKPEIWGGACVSMKTTLLTQTESNSYAEKEPECFVTPAGKQTCVMYGIK